MSDMLVPPTPDDPLFRAVAAFRRAPVPDGPSEQTVAQTLAVLRAADQTRLNHSRWRKTMFKTLRIAALVLAAAAGLIYLAVAPRATARPAFAEVTQKLRDAHTLAYRVTVESPDLKQPMRMRASVKEPGRLRTEFDGGLITVVDGIQGKQLILDPATKTALVVEGKGAKPSPQSGAGVGLVEHLRQLTDKDARPLGEQSKGGVPMQGYVVKMYGQDTTIWIDPKTRLPLRMESTLRVDGKETRTTVTDFQIDPVLDDALFRTEPPAGYAIRKAESDLLGMDDKTFTDPEQATVALLRIVAEKTGGTFPKRLDVLDELDQLFPKKTRKGELPDSETLRVLQVVTRFMMATRPLKEGFGYKSDGIKLGDAGKILFWYRPPGAVNYRAIYGDLHVGDVTAEELPEKPKS